MNSQENLQPKLRQQANELLRRLPPAEREALIIKCWMSHDARWFMAVAGEYGMEAANRVIKLPPMRSARSKPRASFALCSCRR